MQPLTGVCFSDSMQALERFYSKLKTFQVLRPRQAEQSAALNRIFNRINCVIVKGIMDLVICKLLYANVLAHNAPVGVRCVVTN